METSAQSIASRWTRLKWPVYSILLMALISAVYLVFPKAPNCVVQSGSLDIGFDWMCIFRPAVVNLFHGQTPYTGLFFNPPWTLLLLAPLAVLPPGWGAAAVMVLCPLAFLIAGTRLGMKRVSLLMLLFTPFMWVNARQGNIDWLVALGATLPPPIGLFLVTVKPQAGLAVGLFWFIQAFYKGGIKETLRVFAPLGAAYLLSFLIFGLWIIPPMAWLTDTINYSLWPVGIPIGLALLAAAIRGRDIRRAISASPFLSPYVLTYTWSLVYLGLSDWELFAALAGTWIMFVISPAFGSYPLKLLP